MRKTERDMGHDVSENVFEAGWLMVKNMFQTPANDGYSYQIVLR